MTKLLFLITDDSLAEVAQIRAGERAVVRQARTAEPGDVVYRRFHFQESGRFYIVTERRKGGLLGLATLDGQYAGSTVPWSCSFFGVVEGVEAFFGVDDLAWREPMAA